MPDLPHQSDSLHPAKALFDAFPFLLADRVAAMPRRSGINRAATVALRVLCYVRGDLHMPALGHEIPRVVTFVGTYGDLMVARYLFQHSHRRSSLCQTIGGKHFRVHNQSVAVLCQQVAVIAQLSFLAAALARQQRVGIRGGFVSLVAPLLPVK